jgi:O-antigen ligase
VTALATRQTLALPLAAVGSVIVGAMIGRSPAMGLALIGGAAVVIAAFAFPVAHLAALIVATLIVPYSIQNQYGIGGEGAGLIASDVLLLTGLARAMVVLVQQRLPRLHVIAGLLTIGFLALAFLQFLHGIDAGWNLSEAGDELRELIGYGVVLVALPIVLDPDARPRLLKALLAVGWLLGLWGLAQWFGQVPYSDTGDFGVREGVRLTSGGTGQLQGGLYGFPVAVVLGFAALMSGELRSLGRWLVIGMIAINGMCVFFTFERTFIVVTVLACGLVVLRARRVQRLRAIILAPIALLLILIPVAFLSPASLITARERMLSIGQYASDDSVRYRIREQQQVMEEIRLHPLAGSGLGAGMWWGRPDAQVPPRVHFFAHNGYMWLAWKIGIPLAAALILVLFYAAVRPGRARGTPLFTSIVIGAQASLVALLLASVTFPAIRSRPIIPAIGLLVALALVPMVRKRDDAAA